MHAAPIYLRMALIRAIYRELESRGVMHIKLVIVRSMKLHCFMRYDTDHPPALS